MVEVVVEVVEEEEASVAAGLVAEASVAAEAIVVPGW